MNKSCLLEPMVAKTKAVIWVTILIFASYFAFSLADHDIFPRHNVDKIIPQQGYSQTYYIKKQVSEPSPNDAVLKIGLVLFATFAYWKVLGLVIEDYGQRLLVFFISIPIALIAVIYLGFATHFG